MPAGDAHTRIRAVVAMIPAGCVSSYGRVARRAGIPRGARAAAAALAATPDGEAIPWHRVLRADGRIAFHADDPRHREQARRLRAEDVAVIRGRVDMDEYGWSDDAPDLLLPAGDCPAD